MGCTASKPLKAGSDGETAKPVAQPTVSAAGPANGRSAAAPPNPTQIVAKGNGTASAAYHHATGAAANGIGSGRVKALPQQGEQQAIASPQPVVGARMANASQPGPTTPVRDADRTLLREADGSNDIGAGVKRTQSSGSPKPMTRPRWNSTAAAADAQMRKSGSPFASQAASTAPMRRTMPETNEQQPFEARTVPGFMSPTRSSSSKLRVPTVSPPGPTGRRPYGLLEAPADP